MIARFIDLLVSQLKTKSFWPLIEPIFTLLSLYVLAIISAHQYVQWRYHFAPDWMLFLRSYLVKQISVVFVAIGLVALVLGATWKSALRAEVNLKLRTWIRSGARRLAVAALIAACAVGLLLRLSPRPVSHITIKFLERPASFDEYAFTYIVYELNRAQADWHFTLDTDPFNRDSRSSAEEDECGTDWHCDARRIAKGGPFIGITESGFDQDSFWTTSTDASDNFSLISAGQLKLYEPPSIYMYLAHALIAQSTLIHLKGNCRGLPEGAFQPSRLSYGDLFEFVPRRNQLKAAILTAHLSPAGQQLVANCFGLDYMNTCDRLLSLDWLRSGRIHDALEENFGIKL